MLKINSWWNKHSKSHGKLVKSHDFPGFYQHFWMIRPDSMCFSPCFPAETALLPSLVPAPRCSEAPRWSEAPGVPPRVPSPADGRSFNTLNNPFQVWIGMIGMIGGIPDFSLGQPQKICLASPCIFLFGGFLTWYPCLIIQVIRH